MFKKLLALVMVGGIVGSTQGIDSVQTGINYIMNTLETLVTTENAKVLFAQAQSVVGDTFEALKKEIGVQQVTFEESVKNTEISKDNKIYNLFLSWVEKLKNNLNGSQRESFAKLCNWVVENQATIMRSMVIILAAYEVLYNRGGMIRRLVWSIGSSVAGFLWNKASLVVIFAGMNKLAHACAKR